MIELSNQQLIVFLLVLVRVALVTLVAPVFGPASAPLRLRLLLAVALAVLITPLEAAKPAPKVENLVELLVLAGGEALVGLTLGLGVLILFNAMQMAGQWIAQMSGMQLGETAGGESDASGPVFSQLFLLTTLAVFVTIGGHRRVMEALLETFVWLPAGQGGFSRSMGEAMSGLAAESFALGIRAAAPAMVALLVATLVLGLVSRTLPQLNVMALGFGLNALTTLVAVGVSLAGAAWLLQDQLEPALHGVLQALRTSAGHG